MQFFLLQCISQMPVARGQSLNSSWKRHRDKNLTLDLGNTSWFSRLGDAMEARNNDLARHGVWYYVLVINQTEINLSLQKDVGFLFCHAKSMHCNARVWWSLWIKKAHKNSHHKQLWDGLTPSSVSDFAKKNILRVHSTMLKWIDYISKQKNMEFYQKETFFIKSKCIKTKSLTSQQIYVPKMIFTSREAAGQHLT